MTSKEDGQTSDNFDIVSDEERFNNKDILLKAQKSYYDAVIDDIKNARRTMSQSSLTKKHSYLISDPFIVYLLDNINWSLSHQDPQQAQGLLRRLHNNFFLLSQNEALGQTIVIGILELMLFEFFVRQYPDNRTKLIMTVFETDKILAQDLEQATQAKGLRKLTQIFSKTTPTLIGHDTETGLLQLQIEHKSEQLLLTGTTTPITENSEDEPPQPEYPGHIFNPEVIAINIDQLVKGGFDISKGLLATKANQQEAVALGQLFTSIEYILRKEIPGCSETKNREAQKALKSFRSPERLKNETLNIFGNILMVCISKYPDLRETIKSAVNQLAKASRKTFDDLECEFFTEQWMFGKTVTAAPKANQPTVSIPKPVKQAEVNASEEDLTALDPIARLEKIYLSNLVDFRQISDYDPYARGILALILCGKRQPLNQELDSGYLRWQKLVHPDKNSSKLAEEFSKAISEIGKLARKQEFIKDDAKAAVQRLFELTRQMLIDNSVMIVPRQGERHIILTDVPISTMLQRQKYDQRIVKVFFHGQLVDQSKFDQTMLKVGDLIEVVTF